MFDAQAQERQHLHPHARQWPHPRQVHLLPLPSLHSEPRLTAASVGSEARAEKVPRPRMRRLYAYLPPPAPLKRRRLLSALISLLWIRGGYCIHSRNHRSAGNFSLFSIVCGIQRARMRPRLVYYFVVCVFLFRCAADNGGSGLINCVEPVAQSASGPLPAVAVPSFESAGTVRHAK